MLTFLYALSAVILFFLGASIFSFLNVVIYRVPKKLSFVKGRSMCPSCGNTLQGIDMVPVFNWLYLGGKCRFCKAKISPRYPLVELLGGCLALLCAVCFPSVQGVLVFAFLCMLTVVALVDLDTMEIPNGFVLWVAGIAMASIFFFPEITLFSRMIGIFSVSVPLLLITLLVPGGFGGGDIKLMAACGLFLGWELCVLSFGIGLLLGGGYAVWLLATRKKGRKEHFAFGPFLCLGMTVAFFWGDAIIHWYLGLFF